MDGLRRGMRGTMNVRARNAELDGLWVMLTIASNDEETRTDLARCTSPTAWESAFLYKRQARRVTTEVESQEVKLTSLHFTTSHVRDSDKPCPTLRTTLLLALSLPHRYFLASSLSRQMTPTRATTTSTQHRPPTRLAFMVAPGSAPYPVSTPLRATDRRYCATGVVVDERSYSRSGLMR